MRVGQRWSGICGVWAAGLVALSAPADAFNPRSVPIGGRTATMGGAGTAAGNDSAMPYLNPAGLAGLPGDIFAVSASVYSWSRRRFDGFFVPTGVDPVYGKWSQDETIEATSTLELPSSVMYAKHLPAWGDVDHLIGMSLVIPSRERLEVRATTYIDLPDANGFIQESSSVSSDSTDYYVGPTYAMDIGGRVRLGVSLFALYVQEYESVDFSSFFSIAGGSLPGMDRFTRSLDRHALSAVPVAGLQIELTDYLWLGAAVAAPSIHLTGKELRLNAADSSGPGPTGVAVSRQQVALEGDVKLQRPLRFNAGIAYDDRGAFSAAADVQVYLARQGTRSFDGKRLVTGYMTGELQRRGEAGFMTSDDMQQVIDVSLGAEVAVSRNVSLRAGGFGDMSATPSSDFEQTAPIHGLRNDLYGGTLGVGLEFGSFDSTLGVVYAHGKGRFITMDLYGPSGGGIPAIPTTVDTVMFVVSGAVTEEEAKATIEQNSPIKLPSQVKP